MVVLLGAVLVVVDLWCENYLNILKSIQHNFYCLKVSRTIAECIADNRRTI